MLASRSAMATALCLRGTDRRSQIMDGRPRAHLFSAMSVFIADWQGNRRVRAWLYPEDPNDAIADPLVPRADGWRVVIETVDSEGNGADPIRSYWEPTLHEALVQVWARWPQPPTWREESTGKSVDLPEVEVHEDDRVDILSTR